jgi:arylsulfatase A-like enzyme
MHCTKRNRAVLVVDCVGKWHNTPDTDTGPEGPFDRWPVGEMMGFDRFYGLLGGDSNQWYPSLVWDHHPVATPKTPEEGYHLSVDLVDKAILFTRMFYTTTAQLN